MFRAAGRSSPVIAGGRNGGEQHVAAALVEDEASERVEQRTIARAVSVVLA